MQNFEKLGAFYLGKEYDPKAGKTTDTLLLYDAKDLTTHGVIVGMTGSGKTGLAISLIEEAAIDGIPVIAIDPKGDLGNLLLAFPDLKPSDFRPWIDEAEAQRKGLDADAYAAKTAETWKDGVAQWGQDPSRIKKYMDAVDRAIYTPGDASGRPLQILRSFSAPADAAAGDSADQRDRIMSTVSGLLGLIGVDADPIQSREHILLSTILSTAWSSGKSLDLAGIIQQIQKPPFDRIGVFDVESFFPAKERFSLAMSLNNLLASPGFAAWMKGEPLDIQSLLFTAEGKPRVSVLHIAHLSDAERMFFVTILLSEMLAWTRAQSGTGSLRAILYMDEIYGYFPPTANPPSKTPMLTMLKQARAFGVGVLLSTQNPVDLDYKGLANCGTWFIGRLQTERDKARVMEGLEGAIGSGSFDRQKTEAMLASLGDRVFLMRNVHEDDSILFQTRWALTYLRGPMTLAQIRTLTQAVPEVKAEQERGGTGRGASRATVEPEPGGAEARPVLPPDVTEKFLRPKKTGQHIVYRPMVLGVSKLHFVDAKAGVDTWVPFTHMAPFLDDGKQADWEQSSQYGDIKSELDESPAADASFAQVPAAASNAKSYPAWKKSLTTYLSQTVTMDLFSAPEVDLTSKPGETEGEFKSRIAQAVREKRDEEVEKLRTKYAPKVQALQDRLQRAEERVQREKAQMGQQTISTAISLGATLLGALMGRKTVSVGTVTRASTAIRSASRIGKEKGDVAQADESAETLRQRVQELTAQLEQDIADVSKKFDASSIATSSAQIRPRKADISVADVALVWVPWAAGANGMEEKI